MNERLRMPHDDGRPLGERVHAALSDAILEGRLAPGEHLSDKDIAEALGVSRTPVREALQRLTWVGLVEVSPSRYTRVTEVSPAQIAATLEYTGLQAGIALQLAVRRMDEAALAEAVTLLDRMIEANERDDVDRLILAARIFVRHLTCHSGNTIFTRVMHEASLLLERNARLTRIDSGARAQLAASYHRMREAILVRDADLAERCFREQYTLPSPVSHAE
jgi:DNA-binding GntR family transcriptional regulator